MSPTSTTCGATRYDLRFRSMSGQRVGYAFPCDAAGRVDLDALGERALNVYLYARAVIGRELTRPVIEPRC